MTRSEIAKSAGCPSTRSIPLVSSTNDASRVAIHRCSGDDSIHLATMSAVAVTNRVPFIRNHSARASGYDSNASGESTRKVGRRIDRHVYIPGRKLFGTASTREKLLLQLRRLVGIATVQKASSAGVDRNEIIRDDKCATRADSKKQCGCNAKNDQVQARCSQFHCFDSHPVTTCQDDSVVVRERRGVRVNRNQFRNEGVWHPASPS